MLPNLSSGLKRAAPIRPALNLGSAWDIFSGEYVEGTHGEMILNGGLFPFTGVAGGTNSFKTGVIAKWMATCLHRYVNSNAILYDAENSFIRSRFYNLYDRISGVPGSGRKLEMDNRFEFFDRDAMSGNLWFDETVKAYSELKRETKAAFGTTPFKTLDGKAFRYPLPTTNFADSLSEMRFDKLDEVYDDMEIGDSKANPRDLRISNAKRILIEDIPMYTNRGGIYVAMTAQVGKDIAMDGKPQKKKTTFMAQGEKLDKCPPAFYRSPNIAWIIQSGTACLHSDKKTWRYPNPNGKDVYLDNDGKAFPDLMEYSVKPYRSKGSVSGGAWTFLASQTEGFLEGLTAYDMIKGVGGIPGYGLVGNRDRHECVFIPGLTLQRTTIRVLLKEKPILERALNILMELAIMQLYWFDRDPRYNISPEQLYEGLKKQGYDWEMLLATTRPWWCFEEDKHPLGFLSTLDLLRMYLGEYKPYWMQ